MAESKTAEVTLAPPAARTRSPVFSRLPEPGRFWIRHVPRAWPAPESPWTHLAAAGLRRGALGARGRGGPMSDLAASRLDDLLYLPPVAPGEEGWRDEILARHHARGTPVLVQLAPGQPPPRDWRGVVVYDLLPPLLEARPFAEPGDVSFLPPRGGGAEGPTPVAVWPLIAGRTDGPDLWSRGCEALARAGVPTAQGLALDLSAEDRRFLADGQGDEVFGALFHRPPAAEEMERAFARAAAGFGLRPFFARPLPRPPLTGAGNRRLGGELTLAGELMLRLGRTQSVAQSLFQAARWLDETHRDVAALAREGNLGVLTHLSAEALELARESVATGRWGRSGELPALLAELLEDYVSPPPVM